MFDANTVITAYQNLLGWRQYRDTNFINLPSSLTDTDTGEYFQDKSSALRLDYIQTLLPADQPLNNFLRQLITTSTVEMLNDFLIDRQKDGFGRSLLENKVLLNRAGFTRDTIVNQNRFVGFQVRLKTVESLSMLLDHIGLQFTGNDTFDIYLFHSSRQAPLAQVEVTTNTNGFWKWSEFNQVLKSFSELEYTGGVFIIGYYQEDLTGQAINYSNFNWDRGECGSCNNSYSKDWQRMQKYFHFYPIYVPQGSYTKGEMFQMDQAFYVNNESWGLNFKMSVRCDYTEFFIENKFVFKNLLALKVATKVFDMYKYSTETNSVKDDLLPLVLREVEGDKETHAPSIHQQYKSAMKAVVYNTEGLNEACFKCADYRHSVKYSNI